MIKMKLSSLLILITFSLLISLIRPDDDDRDTTQADETTEESPSTQELTSEAHDSTAEENKSSSKITKKPQNLTTKFPKTEPKSKVACTPWPSTVRPLRECCLLPHNPMTVTLSTCFYRCTAREIDERNQVDCGASCFVNVTGIFYSNHLDRERVKNLMIGPSVVSAKWIRIIENGIDTCRFEERGSIHDRLARFFACVNDFMTDNCIQFVQTVECEKTQDLYEQCHRIKPHCEHWPFGYGTLDNCCKIPALFSQQLRSKCHHECSYSELFLQRQAKCDEICRYDDTKLRIDNRFNFDAIKAMLIQSSGNSDEWKTPIEHAIEKCKYSLGPDRNVRSSTIEYEITTLQTCLRDHLASECAEFKDEPVCRKVENFMKNCPDIKPRKSSYHQPSSYGRPHN